MRLSAVRCPNRLRRVASAALLALAATTASGQAPTPPIAAAADLQFALPEIAHQFAAASGHRVRLTFGSSGNFRRQIEQGAPFEVFLSADERYVAALADAGLTVDHGTLYALGRIVLYAPAGSAIDPEAGLGALVGMPIERFAIANPVHAPYGRAAREALRASGAWTALAGHLVLGENAAQAAQFAASGATAGGIIPLSLATAPRLADAGRHALIDAALHRPLRQRMVLLRGAGDTARAFYRYLRGPAARAVLARHGFRRPAPATGD